MGVLWACGAREKKTDKLFPRESIGYLVGFSREVFHSDGIVILSSC